VLARRIWRRYDDKQTMKKKGIWDFVWVN